MPGDAAVVRADDLRFGLAPTIVLVEKIKLGQLRGINQRQVDDNRLGRGGRDGFGRASGNEKKNGENKKKFFHGSFQTFNVEH